MTFVVGLTGGIGSGKTAVSERFQSLGVTVVDADVASRAVVAVDTPALASIRAHFGPDLLNPDGSLNRGALRARVFADPTARRWLERLTHPLIGAYLREHLQASTSPYSVLVNPILIESGQSATCSRILVVDVTERIQLERTMARDGNSEQQVLAIMGAQIDRQRRLAVADDVIVNDRDLGHLDAEVARLHLRYLELCRK
jgi:dephospho-CoA kinase